MKHFFTSLVGKIKKNSLKSSDKNYQITRFISLTTWLQGLLMFFITIKDGNKNTSYVALTYSCLMFVNLIYSSITKNTKPFYYLSVLISIWVEITFLISGGTQGFGILWITIVPIFSLYLLEMNFFFLLNGLISVILILGLWTPLENYVYNFSETFKTRFPILYLMIFIFGIFVKRKINQTEQQLKEQKNKLTFEIDQAAEIQQIFYKQEEKYYEHYSLSYKTFPMAKVSGDLLDIYSQGNSLTGLGIFDISGHGVSSGLLSFLTKVTIDSALVNHPDEDLWQIMQRINDSIIESKGNVENYITGILLRINDNKLEMVNAGHPYPVLYRKATDSFEILEKVEKSKGAIGMKGIPTYFYSQYYELESGDELILFTDGVFECKNDEKKEFGFERFCVSLKKYIHTKPDEQIKLLINDLNKFRGEVPQTDDITLLILKKD